MNNALDLAREAFKLDEVPVGAIIAYEGKIIGRGFNKVITIEEGVINGGFGDGVSSFLLENGYTGKIKRFGLPDSYVEHGSRTQIFNKLFLDDAGIKNKINDFLEHVEGLLD